MIVGEPPWWPPKVGGKLRHFTLHGTGDGTKQVHALNHVLAVFDHDGSSWATLAEWFPVRRHWHYETIWSMTAGMSYWPDGQDPPEKHVRSPGIPCDCCKDGAI